jgi:hypothetical protein
MTSIHHRVLENVRIGRDEEIVRVVRIPEVELDREGVGLFHAGHHEMARERVVVAGARGRVDPDRLLGHVGLTLGGAHRVGDALRGSLRDRCV